MHPAALTNIPANQDTNYAELFDGALDTCVRLEISITTNSKVFIDLKETFLIASALFKVKNKVKNFIAGVLPGMHYKNVYSQWMELFSCNIISNKIDEIFVECYKRGEIIYLAIRIPTFRADICEMEFYHIWKCKKKIKFVYIII